MPRISKAKALDMLMGASGRFCSVTFRKKNDQVRKMTGRVRGVSKLGYIQMDEMPTKHNKGGKKSVNIQTLTSYRMDKQSYTVT